MIVPAFILFCGCITFKKTSDIRFKNKVGEKNNSKKNIELRNGFDYILNIM